MIAISEIFAEATVTLVPDLSGFATKLKTQLDEVITKIETGRRPPKIKVAPSLTRDFIGDLRTQVNAAIVRAQKGVKPIQVSAVLTNVSSAAIAREVRDQVRQVPVQGQQRVTGGLSSVAAQADRTRESFLGLKSETSLLNSEFGRLAVPLGGLLAHSGALTKGAKEGAAAIRNTTQLIEVQTAAQIAFARAQQQASAASLLTAGSSLKAGAIRRAESSAVEALTLADKNLEQQLLRDVQAFRQQLRSTRDGAAALSEHSREAAKTARAHAQLRRGALATSLSFLGIRGATLAASASFLAGAAAIAIFAKALDNATRFNDQLNIFRATAAATAVEMERVRDTARALGADISLPGVTAGDAAEAMTELAKAGLSVENAIAGARGVLQLATAAAIENTQAVELAANALNAFELSGRDATRVADTFANAANAAQGSIVDIGIAFQQASAAGRQVGLSFEDTTAFLTVLARAGLRGSDAGTSLRTALLRLIRPSKEAAAALKDLGVETRDAGGNLRPDVFIQLAEATKNLSPAARDAKLALIGGQDAFRAITILGRQSIEEFIRLRQQLREQGTAADLAAARTQGLRGSLEALSNVLSTIGVRAGQALTPALQGIVEGLTGVVASMGETTLVAQTFTGSVDFLESVLAGLGTTLTTLEPIISTFVGVQAQIANTIGVPTILAAVAAYKLFPPVLARATAAQIAFAASTTRASFALRLLRDPAITGKLAFLASSFNLATLAASALAAGLFFLATRESEAERATRRLTEATEGLISVRERLRTSAAAGRDTALGVNAAELGVLEAQQNAARARAQLTASEAGRGTFERTKLELQLAVALDNVKIAQNGLSDAIARANEAQDEANQASRNAETAQREEAAAIQATVDEARKRARFAFARAGEAVQEAAATRIVASALEERAQAAREQNTVESRDFARRIELLNAITAAVNQVPTQRSIEILIEAPNLQAVLAQLNTEFGTTAKNIREQLFAALTTIGTSPEIRAAIVDLAEKLKIDLTSGARDAGGAGASALGDALAGGIDRETPKVLSAVQRLVNQINASLGRSAGFEVQENLAVIASGAAGARLPALRAQLAEAQQRERDARAAIAASIAAGGPGETPTIRAKLRQAIADQARLTQEIRSINEQLANESKSAADDARQKQDEIFTNLLEAMGLRRDQRQQRIENARLTEGVADDLAATRALRRLVAVQVQRLRDRIAAARREGQNVKVLIDGLRSLRELYRDLGREVTGLQRDRQQERANRIAESIQLDIEFAQTTGNVNAEIRARLREIERLKKLRALAKNDALERKRLRNAIAEQQQAIEDLQKQQDDRNQSLLNLQKQQFEFLQTIQGFSANLIGNLIPGGFTGGLLGGGTTSPSAAPSDISQSSAASPFFDLADPRRQPRKGAEGALALASTAAGPKGFTSGQGNTTNELLRKILSEIRKLNRSTDHPEAKHQRKTGSAAMDYGTGGGGSPLAL